MFMHLNLLGLHQSDCFHHVQYSSLPYQWVSRRFSTRFLEHFLAILSWNDLGLENNHRRKKKKRKSYPSRIWLKSLKMRLALKIMFIKHFVIKKKISESIVSEVLVSAWQVYRGLLWGNDQVFPNHLSSFTFLAECLQ